MQIHRIKNTSVALLLLLSCLVLVACGEKKAASTSGHPLQADAVILAFGDSITYGTGAKRSDSYPARLSELSGLTVINAGVPGETTVGGLKRLPSVLARQSPDLVILCLGGNDFLKRLDASATRQNLAAMLEILKKREIPVVMMAVPQFGLGLTGNLKPAQVYAELAGEFGLALEKEILSEVLSDRGLKADPIHPNAQGYAEIAEALFHLLKEEAYLPPLP